MEINKTCNFLSGYCISHRSFQQLHSVTFCIKQPKRIDLCNPGRKIAWRNETYPDLIFSPALFEVFEMNVFSNECVFNTAVSNKTCGFGTSLPRSPPHQPISDKPSWNKRAHPSHGTTFSSRNQWKHCHSLQQGLPKPHHYSICSFLQALFLKQLIEGVIDL